VARVVSAKKFFHMVGSYFVPSFVPPSLVKWISIFSILDIFDVSIL
jgi:hypothetical protein